MNKKEWKSFSKEKQQGLIISYINGVYDNLSKMPQDFIKDLGMNDAMGSCKISLFFKFEDSIKEQKLITNYKSIYVGTVLTFTPKNKPLLTLYRMFGNHTPVSAEYVINSIKSYLPLSYELYTWWKNMYGKLEDMDKLYQQYLVNKKTIELIKNCKFITLENKKFEWHNYKTPVGKVFDLKMHNGYILRPTAIIHSKTYYFDSPTKLMVTYFTLSSKPQIKEIAYHVSSEDEVKEAINVATKAALKDIKKYYS